VIPIIPIATDSPASRALRAFNQSGQISLAALPPLSLYVHFPWCVKKCPYCDFNSHEQQGGPDAIPEEAYLDALNLDLEAVLPLIWGRRVHSVFIGGGTPSLLSERGLDRLLADVRARINLEADAEITLEANPGTVEAARFASYRSSGVNRLSLGVQSLNDHRLVALGRIHDASQARRAIEVARNNFDNINLDMMFALPGQQPSEAIADLKALLAFEPQHVSLYHLTIEPNTVFAKYPPVLPDDDSAAELQQVLLENLAGSGFERYEISAFARPSYRSRHNLNYWNFGDYLGIGAGAHSKLSFAHRIVRQVRVKQPLSYLARAREGTGLFEETEVMSAELPFEFFLNALRLVDGVPRARFEERTGVPYARISATVANAIRRKLMQDDSSTLKASEHGLLFLNDLQSMFLTEAQ
jgi:oxygen-independent coproporphyrinogen-3 oxidase